MPTPAQEVRDTFLIPQDIHAATVPLNVIASTADLELRTIAESFAENLKGVVRTLSIPFQYTYSQVHSLHWQRVHMAARIRGGGSPDDEQQAAVDRETAHVKFNEYLKGNGRKLIADEVVDRLMQLRSEQESLLAARELSRQGIVLVWSAVEVLARDAFVYLLNRRPQLADQLLADSSNKKRFFTERIDWPVLSSYGFDLSKSLGTYLISKADLSNVPAIRTAYGALFPSAKQLQQTLADIRLWRLSQMRHLIVHRRCVVDQSFIEATGTPLSVGELLWVSPADVEEALDSVLLLGKALVGEVQSAA